MTENDDKELLKRRIKLARAIGLLIGAKTILEEDYEFDKEGVVKLINEVLELLK